METEAVGTDSISTAALAAGSYSFIAVYNGDSNFNGSTGPIEPLTVTKADTSTATVIELNGTETVVTSVALGTHVQDDATVSSTNTSFTLGGRVTYRFFQGATEIGTGETVAGGNASSATAALAAGSYHYTVHYSGDANYNASDSAVEPLTVLTVAQIAPTGT